MAKALERQSFWPTPQRHELRVERTKVTVGEKKDSENQFWRQRFLGAVESNDTGKHWKTFPSTGLVEASIYFREFDMSHESGMSSHKSLGNVFGL